MPKGCYKRNGGKMIDLLGRIFGKLTVLCEGERIYRRHRSRVCKCKCGNTKSICQDSLLKGLTNSCGCIRKEKSSKGLIHNKHGLSGSSFRIKRDRIQDRCYNKKCRAYKNYGGRGIKCERNSFEEFIRDMYDSYLKHCKLFGAKNTTIERVDNNGNYSHSNCTRADYSTQNKNRRKFNKVS